MRIGKGATFICTALKLPTGSHGLILVDLLVQANKIHCTPCSLTIFYWPHLKWLSTDMYLISLLEYLEAAMARCGILNLPPNFSNSTNLLPFTFCCTAYWCCVIWPWLITYLGSLIWPVKIPEDITSVVLF